MDEPTRYSLQWCQEIVDFLKSKGETVTDFPNSDAVRGKVTAGLQAFPDAFYVHYGHGDQDREVGDDGEPIIDLDNVYILSGREVYTMSCLSAKVLGVEAYNKKCIAFWGFVDVVSFTTDALSEFKEALNYGFYLRYEGKTWKECIDLTKQKMQEIINKLMANGRFMAASALDGDMNALVCWDGGAPPSEACPVSRVIVRLFGYKVLVRLRKLRSLIV